MKILAVGDLHGMHMMVDRAEKKFIDGKYDRLIFMGDYVDSKEYTFNEQMMTVDKVNRLTAGYPEEVIALDGNHDRFAYVDGYNSHSGYNFPAAENFKLAFNEGYFRVAWQYKNWLFTHAGICKGWFTRNIEYIGYVHKMIQDQYKKPQLADCLNAMYETKYRGILAQCGKTRGGTAPNGGPLWADKIELWTKPVKGYNQVVGHTRVTCKTMHATGDAQVHFIDCLKEEEDDDFNFLTLELE